MARAYLSFVGSLTIVAALLLGSIVTSAAAQTETQTPTGGTLAVSGTAALGTKQYPEVNEAVQLLLGPKHDKQGAIKALEIAARSNPELPSAHMLMYQVLVQLNQQPAARLELETAAHSNPSDPEPYLILGNIAVQERRIAEATMDFEKAQQLVAKYRNYDRKAVLQRQTYNGLALVAEAREDWVEAEKQLRELLKLAPEDLPAQQRLAHCLFYQGFAKEAYDALKAAKQMDLANAKKNKTKEIFLAPEAIMGQYYSQFDAPRTENAEKWFRSALKQAPDDLATRQVVAVWALEHGMISFAKEQAEAALRIEESDAGLEPEARKYSGSTVGHLLRGLVALWEKDWPEAERDFQKPLDDSPTDFVARNNLALALVEQDDPAKKQRALDYAEANLRDHKESTDGMSTLGWVHFRRGEFDQAQAALDQAVKAAGGNATDADTAVYVAYLLDHQGKKLEAQEILGNLLKAGRPFSMKPEAQKLFEKLNAGTPETTPDVEKP